MRTVLIIILLTVMMSSVSLAGPTDQDKVQGKVTIIDYGSGTVIVNDEATSSERTFVAEPKSKLKNIKGGDKVSVIPQRTDPTKVNKVVKK
jgi:hypothetical protein